MRGSVLFALLALISVSIAHAQVPASERDALIALYINTDGAHWTNKTNWQGSVGTECT